MSNINSIRLARDIEFDSISNGEGLRMVLWFQGCFYECRGCHNPKSWDLDGGKTYLIKDIIDMVKTNLDADGITLSGGDPLLQSHVLKVLLPLLYDLNQNIWLYTGDTFENLIVNESFLEIVNYIDVLVDGPFVENQLDLNLQYRGSHNQRLIDIPKTLKNKYVTNYKLGI